MPEPRRYDRQGLRRDQRAGVQMPDLVQTDPAAFQPFAEQRRMQRRAVRAGANMMVDRDPHTERKQRLGGGPAMLTQRFRYPWPDLDFAGAAVLRGLRDGAADERDD